MHRTAIVTSPAFTGHDTGSHPENPHRIRAIERELARRHLLADRPVVPFEPATPEQVARVHNEALLPALEEIAAAGGGWIDADTVVRPDSVTVARLAAGAGIAAVNAVLVPEAKGAGPVVVIARPPGHHATRHQPMGFCLLNTAAIAAAHALASGATRVAILDWDVHHGNGTQDIFYDRDDVFYGSLHQSPLYPFTGAAGERGQGTGAGTTLNIPLPPGTGDDPFLRHIEETVAPAIAAYGPDLLLISAGYDAHADDPIGNLQVSDEAFRRMASLALDLASTTCAGRVVAILEGGYDGAALARCIADLIEIFDGENRRLGRRGD